MHCRLLSREAGHGEESGMGNGVDTHVGGEEKVYHNRAERERNMMAEGRDSPAKLTRVTDGRLG